MTRLSMVLSAMALSLVVVLGLSGCAGGSSSSMSAQSYSVAITAKDVTTDYQNTTNFTLTVQ
jgi:ABC-type oligopeptide transport system substrate-binding subunit